MSTSLFGSSDKDVYVPPQGLPQSDLDDIEDLIIKHVELATGLKHIVVDGESMYVEAAQLRTPQKRRADNSSIDPDRAGSCGLDGASVGV